MRSHLRLLSAGLAAAIVAALPLAGATALPSAAPAQAAAHAPAGDPGRAANVTLITGDRAVVTPTATGRPSVAFLPAGTDPGFSTRTVGTDVYVIPDTAVPLLRAGRLDDELFNVTKLVAAGYDDAHRDTIPVIATYAGAAVPSTRDAEARPLPSIGGAALRPKKSDAAAFWADLVAPKARGTGIEKLWLDRPVRGHLDRSVAQIGAPEAWAQGYDGTGVTVAVLDSGYDPDHPDLAGRVQEARNFTDGENAHDQAGHGTHVASTIAGTGAASNGLRKGVAPGANLLIGRVLDAWGNGQESWIIAGMEWAVARGAAVVNLSLGGPPEPGCDDPMGQAAERLATQSATLFVVAAGNNGLRESVSSPACAEGVLTVGAVDRDLATANFSSRGPVPGDHRLKPEIAAPGVGIVAANLGSHGGIAYQPMSGTSMATPHVAGAAAILARRHPDWTAAQRRAALVSAVRPGTTSGVYEQGAGVVDVPRAVRQAVFGPGAVDLGSLPWPHSGRLAKPITYTNTGDQPLTLHLELALATEPKNETLSTEDKGVKFDRRTLVVPAHGTASATLSVDPKSTAAGGEHGGRVVAKSTNDTTITTPFGYWLEPELVDLSITVIDRAGDPARGRSFLDVVSLDEAAGERRYLDGTTVHMRLRAGTYTVAALIGTPDKGGEEWGPQTSVTYAGEPELTLTRDTTLVLDARRGVQHQTRGNARPLDVTSGVVSYGRTWDRYVMAGSLTADAYVDSYYAVPTHPVKRGTFELDTLWRAAAPALRLTANGGQVATELVGNAARLDGSGSAPLVDLGGGTVDEIAARLPESTGKVALVRVAERWDVVPILEAAGGSGVVAILFDWARPGRMQVGSFRGVQSPVPGILLTADSGDALRAQLAAGPVRLSWQATAASPYLYNLAFRDERFVPHTQTHDVDDRRLASVDERWYAQREAGYFYELMDAIAPYGDIYFPLVERLRAPMHRTTWYTPDIAWRQLGTSAVVWSEVLADVPRTYRAGQRGEVTWYRQPMPSGIVRDRDTGAALTMAERQANLIGAAFENYRDAYGHFTAATDFLDAGNVELFRNGESLGSPGWLANQWVVPAEPADYRLEVYTEKWDAGSFNAPNWRMSTQTQTSFRFRSQRAASDETVTVLPLVIPFYAVDLDEYNLAAARTGFEIGITGQGQAGYDAGRITSARAWVSYDDGGTWLPVPISTRGPGSVGFVATADNSPAAGGYVSIRVELTDEHGAAVTQTIMNAYGVR